MSLTRTQENLKTLFQSNPINPLLTHGQFIDTYYNLYINTYGSVNSANGQVLEQLVILSLIKAGITHIYVQAKLTFIDDTIIDILLYDRMAPVILSVKTSLRERWKQAEAEGILIKNVYRRAKSYMITLDFDAMSARRNPNKNYFGLDEFVLAHTTEFDNLISELQQMTFMDSIQINTVSNESTSKVNNLELLTEYNITL